MEKHDTSRPGESGRLRDQPVPELLWRLHVAGRTGCLRLHKGAIEKCLWLSDGRPVFARSNEAGDRLTDRLLARGLLSRAQYDQAQELLTKSTGKRVGQLLLEAGLIRERELHESLSEQILRMVESMVSWTDGTWTFESESAVAEPVTLDRPAEAIIMGAARHRLSPRRLWDAIGDRDLCPTLDPEDRSPDGRAGLAALLCLDPSEAGWLTRLDGARTLGELLDGFDVDEHELLALVYTLRLIGRLRMERSEQQAFAFHR
jgi:hypothetical protein